MFKAAAAALGAALLSADSVSAYVPLARHSLLPPFESFKEHTGERTINHWDFGGHAQPKQNFIRLTEDRQSRRGFLYNTEPLEQLEFGLQIKFRISGSGKHLYGDGMALWLTENTDRNPTFSEGLILGHTDTFVGFGILFDTFRNVEHGHVHKDISLLVSDGSKPISLDTERPGCESHYRYWENRQDFDVDNMSQARIWMEKGRLSLEVDKYGKGDWKQCFSVSMDEYNLPKSWREKSFLSLSSSTGALADNHDVLELKVAEPAKFQHMLRLDAEEEDAPAVQVNVHNDIGADEVGEHVNDLAFEVSDMDKALKKLQHKSEHDLERVKMQLQKLINKLEEREDGAEGRISELEKAKERALDTKLDARLSKLEGEILDKFQSRLLVVESNVGVSLEKTKEEMGGGGGWKMPLFFVCLLIGLYMAYTARSLQKLHRRDKLI